MAQAGNLPSPQESFLPDFPQRQRMCQELSTNEGKEAPRVEGRAFETPKGNCSACGEWVNGKLV